MGRAPTAVPRLWPAGLSQGWAVDTGVLSGFDWHDVSHHSSVQAEIPKIRMQLPGLSQVLPPPSVTPTKCYPHLTPLSVGVTLHLGVCGTAACALVSFHWVWENGSGPAPSAVPTRQPILRVWTTEVNCWNERRPLHDFRCTIQPIQVGSILTWCAGRRQCSTTSVSVTNVSGVPGRQCSMTSVSVTNVSGVLDRRRQCSMTSFSVTNVSSVPDRRRQCSILQSSDDDDDDELMLNVLRCHLTY